MIKLFTIFVKFNTLAECSYDIVVLLLGHVGHFKILDFYLIIFVKLVSKPRRIISIISQPEVTSEL